MATVARVLAALSLGLLASCGTVSSEGASHAGPRGVVSRMALAVEPSRPYDRFLNGRGEVVDDEQFTAWAQRAENLEAVYADAWRGDLRAFRIVHHLEKMFWGTGYWMAVQVTAPRCLVLAELQSDCHADWSALDFVGKGPGGARLKALAFEAYEKHLWELEKRNRLVLAVFNALMAGMVWERTMAGVALAEERAAMGRGAPPGQLSAFLEGTADLSVFVNEAEGLTKEVLEAKLAEVEATAPGPRLMADAAALERERPRVESPPEGVDAGNPLWRQYVTYYESRVAEMKNAPAGQAPKPPRPWEGYQMLRERFARGLKFQSEWVARLRKDAGNAQQDQRTWLRGFTRARVEQNVGVKKADLRYVDVFVYEVEPGQFLRVECYSVKSRDLTRMTLDELKAQVRADVADAKRYYGGELEVRRSSLKELYGKRVKVEKVQVVYDDQLKPAQVDANALMDLRRTVAAETGVEIHFE